MLNIFKEFYSQSNYSGQICKYISAHRNIAQPQSGTDWIWVARCETLGNEDKSTTPKRRSPEIFLYSKLIMYICIRINQKLFYMAGIYSQMHIQIVFAVKNHQSSLIKKEHKDEIEKYIAGIITNNICLIDATEIFRGFAALG